MSIRKEIEILFDRFSVSEKCMGEFHWDFVDAKIMMTLGVDRIVEELGFGDYNKFFTSLVEQTQ